MQAETLSALKKFQNDARDATRKKVQEAIAALEARGEAVGFSAVSRECKISRKTLYKVQEFRSLIGERKKLKTQKSYEEDLAARDRVIDFLKQENSRLRLYESELARLKNGLLEVKNILNKAEYEPF